MAEYTPCQSQASTAKSLAAHVGILPQTCTGFPRFVCQIGVRISNARDHANLKWVLRNGTEQRHQAAEYSILLVRERLNK